MAAIKKVWIWLKHNWKVPALVLYSLVMWGFFKRHSSNAEKILADSKDAHRKELKVIEEARIKENVQKEKLLREYRISLVQLEAKFAAANKELKSAHKKRLKEIVKESSERPEKLKRRIEEEFGFEYIEE